MVQGRSILLILALAAPSLAAAETMSFGDAAAILGKSCGKDIDDTCRGVNFDFNRLKDCLYRNQDSMSAPCKARSLCAACSLERLSTDTSMVFTWCHG